MFSVGQILGSHRSLSMISQPWTCWRMSIRRRAREEKMDWRRYPCMSTKVREGLSSPARIPAEAMESSSSDPRGISRMFRHSRPQTSLSRNVPLGPRPETTRSKCPERFENANRNFSTVETFSRPRECGIIYPLGETHERWVPGGKVNPRRIGSASAW